VAVGTDTPIKRAERLMEVVPMLRKSALGMTAIGLVLATAGVVLFDVDAQDMIGSGLVALIAAGLVRYWSETGELVPHGVLQDAPRDVEVEPPRPDRSTALTVVALAMVALPLTWAVDWLDVGAGFLPGIMLGEAAASALTLVRVRAWERANGRRVLYDPSSDAARPYAGAAL
jgi:hypothetical protein